MFAKIHYICRTCTFITMAEINGKQERMVVHLEVNGQHYYYGNLKALCDNWNKETLGVGYSILRNYGITVDRPFINDKCIIRRGIIQTSSRKTVVQQQ